jgi:hypothetical protein
VLSRSRLNMYLRENELDGRHILGAVRARPCRCARHGASPPPLQTHVAWSVSAPADVDGMDAGVRSVRGKRKRTNERTGTWHSTLYDVCWEGKRILKIVGRKF